LKDIIARQTVWTGHQHPVDRALFDPVLQAVESWSVERGTAEQDHRALKRVVRPMLGVKSFWGVQHTLAGIEVMHMPKKKLGMREEGGPRLTPAERFYALAA
jgi:hypothetical protein